MTKKGICLAGGRATRLYPITKVCSKQLLPLYDKPVIAYPLQTLKDMGVLDVLIIVSDIDNEKKFREFLGDGSRFGMKFTYKVQTYPRGLADSFIVGEEFLEDADEVVLILGDNVFIGEIPFVEGKNQIYTFKVSDPTQYGVAVTDPESGKLNKLVEKPTAFIGNDAIVGLYVFSAPLAVEIAKNLTPSHRGELEIVDLIREIDRRSSLTVTSLKGFWFDVGDFDSLLDCSNLVRTIAARTDDIVGLADL